MTLRDIGLALLRGSWIIAAVVIAAVVIAYLFVARVEPSYTSSTAARANTFLSDAIVDGAVAGVTVDLDPSIIRTDTILVPAAEAAGTTAAELGEAATFETVTDGRTNTLLVTATADTAAEAQARAEAVMSVYVSYVDSTIATALATLQAAVAQTTGQVQTYQAQLAAEPTDSVAAQNLAAALSSLAAQNAQVATVQGAGRLITVVAPAEPGESTTPAPLTVLALALLCGLLAGAGIVLILDRLDDRIRTADEVETLTRAPVLAELPYDRTAARRRKKNRLPAASGRQGVLGERLRSLRTSVQVLLPDGKGVVVLTSVEPGDGKTFVSANLAVAWSRAGRKVILVSGDMRRPQIGEYFDDVAGPGLSDLLALRVPGRRSPTQPQIEETLVGTGFRGLRVLPPGSDTDDAADLLGSSNLPRVLGFAGRIADVVVVDSPPALALADASEIARSADGVVLIATVRKTRRRLLREAVETLRANDLALYGIVVNRSRRRLPRTYADYYMSRTPSRKDRAAGRPRPEDEQALEGRRGRGRAAEPVPADEPVEGVADLDELDAALSGRDRRLAALGLDEPEER